jgi:hypothetical protein
MGAPRTWIARWATEIEFAAATADEALTYARAASEITLLGATVTEVYGLNIGERLQQPETDPKEAAS